MCTPEGGADYTTPKYASSAKDYFERAIFLKTVDKGKARETQ